MTATHPFQVMPPLSEEERAALAADIADRGVLVPVVRDQHGRTLDGHHREAIAEELGITYPVEIREVADDDQARDVALALNVARRHLSREQRRQLIAREIEARPDDSDRAIARRLGCDHKTVGSVRRELTGEVPHDEPLTAAEVEEARRRTDQIQAGLASLDSDIAAMLAGGLSPYAVAGVLASYDREAERHFDGELRDSLRRHVLQPRIDAVLALANSTAAPVDQRV